MRQHLPSDENDRLTVDNEREVRNLQLYHLMMATLADNEDEDGNLPVELRPLPEPPDHP